MSRHTYVTPALLCFICTVPAKTEAISLWYIPGDWHRDDMLTTSPPSCTWANLAECQWSWRHEETLNGGYFLKLLGLQAEVERGGPRRCFQTSVKRRETATTCMKVSRPRAHKVLVINILRAPYSQVIASQGLISLASQ
ncbi:hypothetical protein CI102_5401 [Trichoderma harzianum]|uniref:Uncharacterized protein n=1 Tax=Trichoderma harzianum CBS 226.95 TaxID=983964 RepID=A0A2T4AGG5_TRIHA|nr:hypothetical protein M431DRAFT_419366 [Trichoderma harzianum CBS 226.95]PKK51529.1 hypothetical protein CI102_5401 [Trichoderma harzianum]PTB56156.1 hypothetical protein M431DRAFT_419366 [Trichoderma harzianum CBS 226.95]